MSSTSTQIPTLSRSTAHKTFTNEPHRLNDPHKSLNPPLSISARTRSMTKLSTKASRLDVYLDAPNTTSIRSNASQKGLKRRPLMQSLVNAMNTNTDESVKRKGGEYAGDRPRKVTKYDTENRNILTSEVAKGGIGKSGGLKPAKNAHEPITPIRKNQNSIQPTPAREILRNNVYIDDDEDEDHTSPPMNLIARPPTPPRPHMSLTEDIPMASDSPSSEPPLTPGPLTDGSPRPTKMTATSRLLPPKSPVSRFAYLKTTPTKTPRLMGRSAGGDGTLSTTPRRPMGGLSKFKSPAPPVRMKASGEGMTQMTLSGFSGFGLKRSTGRMSLEDMDIGEDEGMDFDVEGAVPEAATVQIDINVAAIEARTGGGMDVISEDTDMSAVRESEDNVNVHGPVNAPPTTKSEEFPASILHDPPPSLATISTPSMPPPSRIPTRSRIPRQTTTITTSTTLSTLDTDNHSSNLPKKTLVPPRRPTATLGRGFPPAHSASSAATKPSVTSNPNPTASKRKPSYPSSLGSGPLAQPRSRIISGPVPPRHLDPTPESASSRQSPRSVSAPFPSSNRDGRESALSGSISRREGLSMETSKSIAGLSDALLKLKMKKIDVSVTGATEEKGKGSTSMIPRAIGASSLSSATAPGIADSDSSRSNASSSRMSSVHRPRQSLAALADGQGEEHAGDKSLAALVVSSAGQGIMKGVIAFVDVKTADGDDVSLIFSDMLRALGAKVLTRPTENLTHIIYKSGKPSTLSWWRKQDEDTRPFVVGLTWITKSKEKVERLDEGLFKVDVEGEDVFQKRRKSMEPKALNALNRSVGVGLGMPSLLQETALNVAQARRKSLLYAPRISSPLKKAYGRTLAEEE